jgi:hypothetical protein
MAGGAPLKKTKHIQGGLPLAVFFLQRVGHSSAQPAHPLDEKRSALLTCVRVSRAEARLKGNDHEEEERSEEWEECWQRERQSGVGEEGGAGS